MEIDCIANFTLSPDGKYINAVTVSPEPGLRFGFTPAGAGSITPGQYRVRGVLSERSGQKDGRPWRTLSVVGSAVPGSVSFKAAA